MSLYRFLADHSVGPFYFQAGTTASTADDGGLLPVGWVPTGGCEPLDASAVAAFFAAGPQFGWPIRQQWSGIGVPRPVTYWVPRPDAAAGNPYREYVLVGLGAGLGFAQYGMNGAAMGAVYP